MEGGRKGRGCVRQADARFEESNLASLTLEVLA